MCQNNMIAWYSTATQIVEWKIKSEAKHSWTEITAIQASQTVLYQ